MMRVVTAVLVVTVVVEDGVGVGGVVGMKQAQAEATAPCALQAGAKEGAAGIPYGLLA